MCWSWTFKFSNYGQTLEQFSLDWSAACAHARRWHGDAMTGWVAGTTVGIVHIGFGSDLLQFLFNLGWRICSICLGANLVCLRVGGWWQPDKAGAARQLVVCRRWLEWILVGLGWRLSCLSFSGLRLGLGIGSLFVLRSWVPTIFLPQIIILGDFIPQIIPYQYKVGHKRPCSGLYNLYVLSALGRLHIFCLLWWAQPSSDTMNLWAVEFIFWW